MEHRRLGKTNFNISSVSLGTWQLGTRWGDPFNASEARKILETALEHGINFIDTADIYNNGLSEVAIGEFLKDHSEEIFVATKCGRGLNPHVAAGYTPANVENFVDESLKRLQVEKLDLLQLHCPPIAVYDMPELWEGLENLKKKGKLLHYGVSVETVEEGLRAMEYGIASIQIIFNMFRHKPARELFQQAKKNDVGIITRVPLASGLLTGKFSKNTQFGEADHRSFNRHGEAFDKGETFSGVDYETGLQAVDELKKVFGTDQLAPIALRWILMFDAVSTVIPGASRAEQVVSNVVAGELPPLTEEQMAEVDRIYSQYIADQVEGLW